jgi:CHAD domain-containing protein
MTAGDVVTAAFAGEVAALARIDPALRTGPTPGVVHAARVIVRRVRSHLRTFAPVLDDAWAADMNDRVRWLSDGLAAARDADVLLAGLVERAATIPDVDDPARLAQTLAPLRERHAAAYRHLDDLVGDPRYAQLLATLAAVAHEPAFNEQARLAAARAVPLLMRPAWRRLAKAARKAGRKPSDAELHAIRIRAKYLRYAAEALIPVEGRKAKRFARRVETLQNRLGQFRDAVNAAQALREQFDDPLRAELAGRLAALESADAARLRRGWRRCLKRVMEKEVRFW